MQKLIQYRYFYVIDKNIFLGIYYSSNDFDFY